jgi:hypothetical protein
MIVDRLISLVENVFVFRWGSTEPRRHGRIVDRLISLVENVFVSGGVPLNQDGMEE